MNRSLKRGLVGLSYGLVPYAYRKADVVAAVSRDVRHDLAVETGIPLEGIRVLHNPVVVPELTDLSAKDLHHPWLSAAAPPVVLAVGRFTQQKNFPLLLRAFAKVRSARLARLIILGDGELRSELEALAKGLGIAEDVDLPGFDPNPFRFMSRSAVYALSSDWEGLPTALIEALACGAPVVTTDCAGAGEVLLGGRLGRIVPRGDADALAAAIAGTIEAPGPREERVARAADFGLESAVDHYLQAAGLS
jgi:glycosyltransferase involved in cell wall biosynthesis